MDSICAAKAERACANLKHNLVSLVRMVEVGIALVIVSWFSTRIPFAIRISSDFFRCACALAFSPRFVFLLGNAIVLTLFAKSGNKTISHDHRRSDEVLEEGKRCDELCDHSSCVRVFKRSPSDSEMMRCSDCERLEQKELRRSETENSKSWRGEIGEAETMTTTTTTTTTPTTTQMSDEELRDRVEAFIAKQLRFHIEETMILSEN
ncbi:hypothetical protein Scep_020593 [Stephania cephalantha]|uniref:DUF4408 domain-containing protein n=1 Tax=Stephania cephalantha TaxID=152367 RepID=A0AAP0ICW2_9MAGN